MTEEWERELALEKFKFDSVYRSKQLAVESEKLNVESEKLKLASNVPWWRSSIPWLAPTLSALVACSCPYTNCNKRAK